jgi:hypothetical protein
VVANVDVSGAACTTAIGVAERGSDRELKKPCQGGEGKCREASKDTGMACKTNRRKRWSGLLCGFPRREGT